MKSIEINGQPYPFRIGLRALENFEIRTKKVLADFNGEVHLVMVLAHEGVKAGQRSAKVQEVEFEEFRDLMDQYPASYKQCLKVVMEEITALMKEIVPSAETDVDEEKKSDLKPE